MTAQTIENMAWQYHATREQIATTFEMDEKTLRRRFEEDPELYAAFKRGRLRRERHVIRRLWVMLNSKNCPPAVMIFALKNICGWTDSPKRVEVTGADGGPIVHVAQWGGPASRALEAAVEAEVIEADEDDITEDDIMEALVGATSDEPA